MKRWKYLNLVFVLPAVAADPCTATNRPSMMIEALVNEALEKNPELNFYKTEIAAAAGERKQAATYSNPEAAAEIGRKRVNGRGFSAEGMAWSVSLAQPFEWPGRVALRKAIANRQIELAENGYEQFRAALAARVRTLAFGLAASQEKARAARAVAARGQELAEVLVQRDPAGITPLLETRIIEATVITAKRRAAQAVKEAQVNLYELNQLRGAALDETVSVSRGALKLDPLRPVEELLAQARMNNYQLRSREAELQQQGFRADLARNQRWPAVSIGPYYSQEKADDTERAYGVGVSVPLPLWNRNEGNIQSAKARQQQAEASLLITQREIERDLRESVAGYNALLEQMAFARSESLQQLEEAADLADRHYRLGAVPITTYVELQEKYLDATEAILDNEREALESFHKIQLLTGRNLPAALKLEKETGK
jgi:cobalt-zinc-cadmium efflux system outer membrane protein